MTDIVDRLRDAAQFFRGGCEWPATAGAFTEAADEIERLRKLLVTLTTASKLAEDKLHGEFMEATASEVLDAIGKAKAQT